MVQLLAFFRVAIFVFVPRLVRFGMRLCRRAFLKSIFIVVGWTKILSVAIIPTLALVNTIFGVTLGFLLADVGRRWSVCTAIF